MIADDLRTLMLIPGLSGHEDRVRDRIDAGALLAPFVAGIGPETDLAR